MNLPSKEKRVKIYTISLSILFILLIVIIKPTRYCLKLILIAIVFAYVITPIVGILERKVKLKRKTATIITMVAVFAIICFLLYEAAGSMFREMDNAGILLDNIQEAIIRIQDKIDQSVNDAGSIINKGMIDSLFEGINRFISNIGIDMINGMMSFGGDIVGYVIVPLMSYYFIVDGKKIIKRITSFLKPSSRIVVQNIVLDISNILNRYIMSQIILSGVVTIITFLILIIFKVPFALFLSIINGVFNIIPYFGPFLGAIPCVLSATSVSYNAVIGTAISLVILQQIEGNFICPIFTSYSVKIHPLIVIILIVFGETVGGVFGMVLSVPLGIVFKQVLEDVDYYTYK